MKRIHMKNSKINKFRTRYFYIVSVNDEKFIRWDTVKGDLNEDIVDESIIDNYEILSDLMAMDIRVEFGEEYDVWEVNEKDFKEKVKPI
ncbi:hypothetical protein [Priestia megaterium]|uniref:hypothetical protein n=1 Tax=Priestia megaterium TaxID=1404 RepID=UPI0024528CE5|nr:hypothetical protein [Priestia megaterium]MDH3161240.1 hypothetical protein [Priestia megaterium]MED4116970.1 hypothetical protein [Priestia megaterium]